LCDSAVLRQELKIHFIYSAGQLPSLGKLWKFTLLQANFSADRSHGKCQRSQCREPFSPSGMKQLLGNTVDIQIVPKIWPYSIAPTCMDNKFQDLPRLRETAGNTEGYI
jgi:hypothetical protein